WLKGNRIAHPLPIELASGGLGYLCQQALPGIGFIETAVKSSRITKINRVDYEPGFLRVLNGCQQIWVLRIITGIVAIDTIRYHQHLAAVLRVLRRPMLCQVREAEIVTCACARNAIGNADRLGRERMI